MRKALQEAIDKSGGQVPLADALGVSQSMISFWLHTAKKGVPAEMCLHIENLTGVRREALRPDIFGRQAVRT